MNPHRPRLRVDALDHSRLVEPRFAVSWAGLLLAELYDATAKECGMHEVEHCQDCAAACRKCASECREMAGSTA